MIDDQANEAIVRHRRVVSIACVAGSAALIVFRVLIEFGYAPRGSLRVSGVPLEYLLLGWFLVLAAVTADARKLDGLARRRAVAYEWWIAILGLAGTMWLLQSLAPSKFASSVSWVYWFACGCAIAVFLSAASVERPRNLVMARDFLPDILRIFSRPPTWICVAAGAGLLTLAPRSLENPTSGQAFQRWFSKQPRESVPGSWRIKPVTLVELTDYQCAVCRRAATAYRGVIDDAEARYGQWFAFLRVDFPLETECNPVASGKAVADIHPAACEAAAAVRLAKAVGSDMERQVVEWLWTHQKQLTPELVFDGIKEQFRLDVRGKYADLLPVISRDAAEGRRLQVSGTPTYFLNGRRLRLLPPETMAIAIAIELEVLVQHEQSARR